MKTARSIPPFHVGCALAAAFACSGPMEPTETTRPTALAGQLESAFSGFSTTTFGAVGTGGLYHETLGGTGPATLERHTGTVFRWNVERGQYDPADEVGPSDGVRFVLYPVLDAVRNGAPLVEVGSITYYPLDERVRADLAPVDGGLLSIEARGVLRDVPEPQTLTVSGTSASDAGEVVFSSTRQITPADQGTSVREFRLAAPNGLDVRFETVTTRIVIAGGEASHQRLEIVSRFGRVSLVGDLVGGNGFHELSIDGRPTAIIEQVSGLGSDLIGSIRPVEGVELTSETIALARQVFRTRNFAAIGAEKLIEPVF